MLTCVCETQLSGKCRHGETVSSRSNVVCRPETALMLICDRRCAQLTLCLGEKTQLVITRDNEHHSCCRRFCYRLQIEVVTVKIACILVKIGSGCMRRCF